MADNDELLNGSSDVTLMDLIVDKCGSQVEFARKLREAFQNIKSDRKVTKKSVQDWVAGTHKPRWTPEETYEACKILECTLEELAEASRNTANKNQTDLQCCGEV